jgi:hypothetical protein
MKYFNKLIAQYKVNVSVVSDPRDIALARYNQGRSGIPFPDRIFRSGKVRLVSECHPHIAWYLGKDLSVERNKKLRNIRDLLVQKADHRIVTISKNH